MNESNPYDSPSPNSGLDSSSEVRPLDTSGDGTGGLIPYKNPPALAAYYLGIMGLRKRAQNPVVKGSVHAWIGIVLGFLATLMNLSCIGSIIFALIAEASR